MKEIHPKVLSEFEFGFKRNDEILQVLAFYFVQTSGARNVIQDIAFKNFLQTANCELKP